MLSRETMPLRNLSKWKAWENPIQSFRTREMFKTIWYKSTSLGSKLDGAELPHSSQTLASQLPHSSRSLLLQVLGPLFPLIHFSHFIG